MADFRHLIGSEEENVRSLHEAVHAAFKMRSRSASAREEWQRAAARFRAYESLLEHWLHRIASDDLSVDRELMDFAITYIEIDPDYFQSGYIKQRLLRKLKSAKLSKCEATRLSTVIIDAMQRPEVRAFKDYCRLAAAQELSQVRELALALSEGTDDQLALRARMMLERFEARAA